MDGFIQNPYFWAQIFGFCAMSCSVIAWQLKNPKHILLMYVPGSFFWSIQYFLLGAYVGLAIAFASSFKDLILAFINKKNVPKIIIGYLVLCFVIIIFRADILIDIVPVIAILSLNIPLLKRGERALFARGCLMSQGCWFIYNFHYGAWMGVACSTLLTISCIIGMARHEKWEIGKCYRTFLPSLHRALFNLTPRTFP